MEKVQILLMAWVCLGAGWARNATAPGNGTGPAPLESRVYEYGVGGADVQEMRAALGQVLTPEGKTVFLPSQGKVLVQDVPGNFDIIEAVMKGYLEAPAGPNLRVDVIYNEAGTSTRSGADVGVRVGGDKIRFQNRPMGHNGVEINVLDQSSSSSRMNNSFLVVQSGGTASLRVAQEVPVLDYFYQFACHHGYWTETGLRWESVGTELAVQPVWRNGLVDVTVFPRLTALVGGRRQIIDVKEMATRVTVAEGATVAVGGVATADGEFRRNFFSGGVREGRSVEGGFSVRVTRMEAAWPAAP